MKNGIDSPPTLVNYRSGSEYRAWFDVVYEVWLAKRSVQGESGTRPEMIEEAMADLAVKVGWRKMGPERMGK